MNNHRSNKERAEDYADIVAHNEVYFSEGFSILNWVHKKRFQSIKKLLGNIKQKVVLDAGSGEGFLLSKLEAKEKYGIEISEKRSKRSLKKFPHLKIAVGDIENLPFEDNKFDIIICSEVLEHVDQYQKGIRELKRCLKPTGKLILSFPNEHLVGLARGLIFRFPIHESDHVNWITSKDMKRIVAKKFISSNVPALPYPFCLYQIYCFNGHDFLDS